MSEDYPQPKFKIGQKVLAAEQSTMKADIIEESDHQLIVRDDEQLLSSLDATVTDWDEAIVELKINDDISISFPRVLFQGMPLAYGLQVLYQVKERKEGSRFQEFSLSNQEVDNPNVERLEAMVNSIGNRNQD